MKKLQYVMGASLMLLVTACVSPDGSRLPGSMKGLVVADLTAAQEVAVASGDEVAALCYAELALHLGSKKATVIPDGAGVVTAFQIARGKRRSRDLGPPESINTRCAPLIVDAAKTMIRLRRLVGIP